MDARGLERALEKRVVRFAQNHGIMTLKFTPKGQRGWPDRIFFRDGIVCWIEFKARGEKPEGLQKVRIDQLLHLSCNVMWSSDYDECEAFLCQVFGIKNGIN